MLGAFPQEIYEEVIRHLRDDHITLSATALTCYSLLSASQKCLFSRVVLYPSFPKKGATSSQLKRILSHSPHVGGYVDCLELHMSAGRCQWTSWITSLEYCLPHLSQLKALAIRVDQSPPFTCGFTVRAAEDHEGVERIMRTLTQTVQLPSLVYLDTYCFDISSLLQQCWHLRELKLSKPILPTTLSDIPNENPVQGRPQDCHFVFLEALHIEIPFENRNRDATIWRTLYNQGISLRKLKRFSIVGCEFGRDLFTKELSGVLEQCSDTIDVLEIQTHFNARISDLNSLDWTKAKLPSLRVLHLHLYSLDSLSSHEDLQSFITALMDLLCRLSCSPSPPPSSDSHPEGYSQYNSHSTSPSSRLEHLIFTDHSLGREHLHLGNWRAFIVHVLSDRTRFPAFMKLSWYACSFVADYLQNHIFAGIHPDKDDELPFEVDLGVWA